ncbi:MAG: Amt family ammonium transporter [Flavobacteriales bacterium]|jgi:Amt family ammonium transporter
MSIEYEKRIQTLLSQHGIEPSSLPSNLSDLLTSLNNDYKQPSLSDDYNRTILEAVNTAIFVFGDTFYYANPAFEQLLGYSMQALKDKTLNEVFNDNFVRHHERLLNTPPHHEDTKTINTIEIEVRCTRGVSLWIRITPTRAVLDGKERWIASAIDITQQKTNEARLCFQAYHDQLTGLPNKIRLIERVESALAKTSRDRFYKFAVLVINIDRFNVINDSLGHHVGDQLLLEISKRIRICIRRTDFAARIDGDEFAVVMDNVIEHDEINELVTTLQSAISEPIHAQGHNAHCSATVGISLGSFNHQSAEQLIRDANIALYRAKEEEHCSSKLYDTSMHEKAKKILTIESDLRVAIANNALELFYQPIINLRTGRVEYVEALIRWRKRNSQIIEPIDFIPLAEESGAILQLGNWVITEATRAAARWNSLRDRAIGVSINVSSRQFVDGELPRTIEKALAVQKLDPELLKIELTETSLIDNSDAIQGTLTQIRALGCDILVDDFGTGYSSLSYLHQFPVSAIKIDRSFITNLEADPDNTEVLKAIINLGHNLGLPSIAEGIENTNQAQTLIELGCDYAQGFLFSEAVEEKFLTEIFTQNFAPKQK